VVDFSPRLAIQPALVDAGNLVFYPDAQILRFKRPIGHN
jgi:hypothetical protein